MVNKRVGVRLVAENGQRVKAELEGIGDTGEKSFKRIGTAAEMTRRVAGRVFGVLAAGFSIRAMGDMAERYTQIGNTLRVLGIEQDQVGATIQRIGDIARRTLSPLDAMATLYQRVSMAAGEMGAGQEDILRFTENIGLALAQQGGSAEQASGALLQLSQALGSGTVRAQEFNSILNGAYPIALAAARGIEAAGGSVAKLRQLVNEGKISSAEFFQAILSQTEELESTFSQTMPTISQAWQVLTDSITLYVGETDSAVGISSAFAQVILVVANNVERLAAYATAAALVFGGRLAAGLVSTAIATASLSGALRLLRVALISTGVGALIVAAGELIYWFSQLVKATGGFGEAMTLLGEVAAQIWDGIVIAAKAVPVGLNAVWNSVRAGFYRMVEGLATRWADFLHGLAGTMRDIPLMEGAALKVYGSAVRAGSAVYEFGAAAASAEEDAAALREEAGRLVTEGFDKAKDAVSRLAEVVTSAGKDSEGALAGTQGAANNVTDALDKAGDAGKKAGKKIKEGGEEALTGWAKTVKTLQDYAASAMDLAGGIGDSLVSAFRGAEDAVVEFVKTGKLNFTDMVTSMIADLARLAVRRFILGPIANALGGIFGGAGNPLAFLSTPSFEGGGHTGLGARAGGLDGKGGYLAMVHPRERIIDETRGGRAGSRDAAPVIVNISTPNAESFRQSRTQVAADISRAVSLGRRSA
ncbi:MAG: tape measure protein [Mesorhizobium sp.]